MPSGGVWKMAGARQNGERTYAPQALRGQSEGLGARFLTTKGRAVMPLLRHQPGVAAPGEGMYVLVGHYGEPVGVPQWFDKDAKFPLAAVPPEVAHPVWYVQIGVEASGLLAA
jgi:hypothetical protein